jgi:MFS superfamily sulfate permease-like transporter
MMPWESVRPKLLETLAGYNRRACVADVVAGLTVGVVALPLAMAFGIASGVTPQAGIYTAIVGGFLVSLLGGSSIQISGPTGAFVVIVAGIIATHGMSGLLMVTMMAGAILVFLAVTGLGRILGPFLFGMTDKLADITADLSAFSTIVILRLRNMTAIDATGLHALEQLNERLRKSGRVLILCGARQQPAAFLDQAEFVQHVGASNIVPNIEAALLRARQLQTDDALESSAVS